MEQSIGAHLQALRLSRGFSLRDAAKRSGLSHGYIRDVELGVNRKNGTQIVPMPQTLRKYALAYRTDYTQLLKIAGHLQEAEIDEAPFESIELDLSLVLFIQVDKENHVNYHLSSTVFTEIKSLTEYISLEEKLENTNFLRLQYGIYTNLEHIRAFDIQANRIYFDKCMVGKYVELSWIHAQKHFNVISRAIAKNNNSTMQTNLDKPPELSMVIRNIVF